MSGPQEECQTDTKSKSQTHCLKHTRNSSRESSATIYELQKIMNIEVPLDVQHFKSYELKKKHEHKCSILNVNKFKTKPPFHKWSIPYDRGKTNTAFVEKNHESSAVCRCFSEKPQRKLS